MYTISLYNACDVVGRRVASVFTKTITFLVLQRTPLMLLLQTKHVLTAQIAALIRILGINEPQTLSPRHVTAKQEDLESHPLAAIGDMPEPTL